MNDSPAPIHGGNIDQASAEFGIAPDQWLDLSTGINARPYPFSPVHPHAFQRLPNIDPALVQAAKTYYQAENILPVAGSQSVIQLLPEILPPGNLWVPRLGYQEYAHHWRKKGRSTHVYSSLSERESIRDIEEALEQGLIDHLLLINPNNPTGVQIPSGTILKWAKQLHRTDGIVVVDEAFMDARPENSVFLCEGGVPDNVIVLRSFGKFFGLAGVRIGFVSAPSFFSSAISSMLGPWSVNGVAQHIAIEALLNTSWQQEARALIVSDNNHTYGLVQPLLVLHHGELLTKQGLFSSWILGIDQGRQLYRCFAKEGVLIRLIPYDKGRCLIRIGNISQQTDVLPSILCEHIASFA